MWGYGSRTTSTQKQYIRDFRSITNTSEKVAIDFLKKANWKLDVAINNYYNQRVHTSYEKPQPSKSLIELFEKYKEIGFKDPTSDQSIDAIQGEGMVQFMTDLGLELEDIMTLVIVWKLGCKNQYQIHRDEFLKSLAEQRCDNLQAIKSKLPIWRKEIEYSPTFKHFYNYVFEYNKASEAKTIPCDVAVATWNVILKGKYKHLDEWCSFVENHYKKAISRDTWQQFYEFTQTIKTDFSNFDFEGAWPVLIDEFVEYMTKKKTN